MSDIERARQWAENQCPNWPDGIRPMTEAYLAGLRAGRGEADEPPTHSRCPACMGEGDGVDASGCRACGSTGEVRL